MSAIRLYAHQVEWLKRSIGGHEIKLAVERWKNGEFVVHAPTRRKKGDAVLQQFSIKRKIAGITDAELRQILDAHIANPRRDKIQSELRKTNNLIDFLTEQYRGVEYVTENTPDDWDADGM